jgi:hypothetical protein
MFMKFKKTIAVIAALTMLSSGLAVGAFATDGVDYKINSTYENIDWNTYQQYKTDLHSHSTASDGESSKTQTVEAHYKYGFDIMALTDHGTVDYGWNTTNVNKIVKIGMAARKGKLAVGPLSSSGTTADGKNYTYDGTYYTQYESDGTADRSMMEVPFGNEQNPTSFNNAHVCTWFADYGNNSIGGTSDYETPIKNVDKLGGLSVINHPGEYSGARNEKNYDAAYNMSNVKYKYVVNKFANILENYDSCLGIDINSKGDYRTRYDRKLWDLLLQKVVPTGRNVYAVATSDSHRESIINSGYTIMCMPEKTAAALKSCMKNGEFFAASRYIGSKAELYSWYTELNEAGTGSELSQKFSKAYDSICQEEKSGGQDTIYEFDENAAAPKVTKVSVDENDDEIAINTQNAYLVHWIANGKVIAVGNSIDLDDYSDEIGSYVRAEIVGEGGVIYTQAFTLEYDNAPQAQHTCFCDLGGVATCLADTVIKILAFVLNKSGISDLLLHIIYK